MPLMPGISWGISADLVVALSGEGDADGEGVMAGELIGVAVGEVAGVALAKGEGDGNGVSTPQASEAKAQKAGIIREIVVSEERPVMAWE